MTADAGQGGPRSLYLHIPFCTQRCAYCDFAISLKGEGLQDRYVQALMDQLKLLRGGRAMVLDTVYLGGGTPNLLRPDLLERLLAFVFSEFSLAATAEVTIEVNPDGITRDMVARWLVLGINRVSLGVQSLDDASLRWLGRTHSASSAVEAIRNCRLAGLADLSCDLIYAVPGQDRTSFESSLRRLLQFHPEHVSCYELTVERNTPLQREIARHRREAPSVEAYVRERRLAVELLAEEGLVQYEVSNYARAGFRSQHNLTYWKGHPYLAAGAGAHGFLASDEGWRLGIDGRGAGLRYWHFRDAATYIRNVDAGGRGIRGYEWLDDSQVELERLACGLRLSDGVGLRSERQLARARELELLGLLEVDGTLVRATTGGVDVLDRLTLELSVA